ncbi:MAG: 3-dehydroquinate dehydratase [Clostridiales bacterium]|nr:3-dehydroquinate dehydratase [Clostridiales bacterium]
MKKILVINGVNLNMLGLREPNLYGKQTYADLVKYIKRSAKELGVKVKVMQSNCEWRIVYEIQRARGKYDGIVINAGAYTHTSLAILDALKAAEVPTAEVHLTDIHGREEYRNFSYISQYAFIQICGKGFAGYQEALAAFCEKKG